MIAAIGGEPDFSSLTFELGEGVIRYGAFLNTIVNFLIIGTAMFFVVRLAATLYRRRDAQVEAVEATEIALLTEIRDLLRERAT